MEFTKRNRTHFATTRKDTGDVLGVVGKDYEIVPSETKKRKLEEVRAFM